MARRPAALRARARTVHWKRRRGTGVDGGGWSTGPVRPSRRRPRRGYGRDRLDHRDHDLFSGAAGVLWTGAMLSEVLGDSWPAHSGCASGRALTASARPAGDLLGWPTNPDFDASETTYFGAAHGAAGIALALASWGRVADASTATSWPRQLSRDSPRTPGTATPSSPTAVAARSRSRRGAMGRQASAGAWNRPSAAPACSATSARGPESWCRPTDRPWPDPTMCHGTAGSLETYRLLDDRGGPRDGRGPPGVEAADGVRGVRGGPRTRPP